jgi:serine/threonine protein kinase
MTGPAQGVRLTGGSDGPGEDELEFITHKEEFVGFAARFGPDRQLPERPALLTRTVTLGDSWTVLQHRLPLSALGDPNAYALLEREVGVAMALENRYGPQRYGEVFARMVGFDLDAPEPFILYRITAGGPIGACRAALGVDEQHAVITQLTLAVRLLEHSGIAHRAIGPDTVSWDGKHVRLAEAYATLRTGEPRGAFGTAPWASPEQREGTGTADARDDLWAVGQLVYFLLSGRADQGLGPPADLDSFRQLAALAHGGVFAPTAAARPTPAGLMRLLNVTDPLAAAPGSVDLLARGRAEFDDRLAEKRRQLGREVPSEAPSAGPTPRRSLLSWPPNRNGTAGPPPAPSTRYKARQCPHCLLPVIYDEQMLITVSPKGDRTPLDLSGAGSPDHVRDALRKAYHRCPHAAQDKPHELPVPYLTNGEPLSIALVGSSAVGKTHLLAAMLGEVEQGALKPHGLTCLPLNPDSHRRFLRERVQSLHQGRRLASTGQQTFARFADGLLVSGPDGSTRPVVFFDLAGEDLVQDGEVTGFLMGVSAFIFVVDPLRALRLTTLDGVRERSPLSRSDLGDEAFTTVLNRIPRKEHGYVDAPAALAVNKSDLVRFDPTVDRWLGRALPPRFDPEAVRAESRDAYAFLAHHASPAWLKPFDDCARCTLHFVAATGGEARGDAFPHGVRPRRVLAPLLSIFAMCGLLPGAEPGRTVAR